MNYLLDRRDWCIPGLLCRTCLRWCRLWLSVCVCVCFHGHSVCYLVEGKPYFLSHAFCVCFFCNGLWIFFVFKINCKFSKFILRYNVWIFLYKHFVVVKENVHKRSWDILVKPLNRVLVYTSQRPPFLDHTNREKHICLIYMFD